MPDINIKVRNKVAKGEYAVIVCGNSDYVAHFDFDSEWDEYTTKTAHFEWGGRYEDRVFTGNECAVPVVYGVNALTIGVFAGDIRSTTPAFFKCVPCGQDSDSIPADPTPDVYNQIMELLNKESGIWYPAVDDAGNMSWTRSISETEPQPVNIKGPKGDVGAQGETGPQGPKGDTGATGPQGPKGDTGAAGKDGADGKDGVDGKSAYELAQDNGFQGTMQEWLASLVGADGTDGNDGVSPAVSVAAITGGNRVTITDAEGAKTFDVMDGAQGASGADGKDYVLTDADKQEIAEAAAGFVDVPSVQPDWNQNDTTAADYVKNRPFYTGNPVETVLVEESTVTFAKNGSLYGAMFPTTFEATVGNIYKVSWDGSDYECTCVDFNGYPAIGNISIAGAGSDTGEPFIMAVNNGVAIQIITADTSNSHTFSIRGFVASITKIGAKYIPKLPYMDKVNPTGTGAFSLNRKTGTTVGEYSFAEGYRTTASGGYSHAEGDQTTASGGYSHAEGRQTTASGGYSHAEGRQTTASGDSSHAEGRLTTASGYYSHAEGQQTMASGDYSHAEGDATKASSKLQHVQGKYNIEDATNTYAHIVGNGDNITRSNAHTLDWSGNAWFAGTVEGTALILPSSTADSTKKFRITVDDSGTITATEVS